MQARANALTILEGLKPESGQYLVLRRVSRSGSLQEMTKSNEHRQLDESLEHRSPGDFENVDVYLKRGLSLVQ